MSVLEVGRDVCVCDNGVEVELQHTRWWPMWWTMVVVGTVVVVVVVTVVGVDNDEWGDINGHRFHDGPHTIFE